MNDFDKIGKNMPYEVPEGFFESVTQRTMERMANSRRKNGHNLTFAIAVGVALVAVVVLLTVPSTDPTDYRNISDCESIDEVIQQMSMEELQMWASMNYPTTEQENR